ncbi:unnamed protein product, partial [Coregonus sp. 'balchen']
MVNISKARVHRDTYQLYWQYCYYQQHYTCTCRRHNTSNASISNSTLTFFVNLMQPKSYCPLTRESTEQTGMLDHRR